MRVEILGTVGYHPTEQRHTTCVVLPELGVVFDAGTSMFRLADRLTTDTLDIFLSHAHLDHIIGLTFFFSLTLKHPLSKITVHGAEQKLDAIRQHLFSPDIFPAVPPYEWMPHVSESGSVTIGHANISWFPLHHPGGSRGYRVDVNGRSLAFITDTTASPDVAYIEQIRGVDLLLHECNFPDGYEKLAALTGHSCLTPVLQVAAKAEVKRLVLMHVDPVQELTAEMIAQARPIFSNVELAHDGMSLAF